MIVAVLGARPDDLAAFVRDNGHSATFFVDFMRLQGLVAAFHGKALVGVETGELGQVIASLRGRVDALLEQVLEQAAASGHVAANVTVTDMRIVNRMLIAATTMPDMDQTHALEHALDILLAGLAEDQAGY